MDSENLSKHTRPSLIIVSGRPASGKSTLSTLLSESLKLPLISRDRLKEAYLHSMKLRHAELPANHNEHIYESFFELIEQYLSKHLSVIAEAAFQHQLWENGLRKIQTSANIKLIVCQLPLELARERFFGRLKADQDRAIYHGDELLDESSPLLNETFQEPKLDVSSIYVNTSNGYQPNLETISSFLQN